MFDATSDGEFIFMVLTTIVAIAFGFVVGWIAKRDGHRVDCESYHRMLHSVNEDERNSRDRS